MLQSLWRFVESHANANQFLFTPNPSTYGPSSYPRGDRQLVLIPTLMFAPPASIVANSSKTSHLIRDPDAPFPVIPCIYAPPPPRSRSTTLVVHFHGTGGDAHKSGQMWFGAVEQMHVEERCAVLSVEYPGYGIFPGRASEEQCQLVAMYVLRFLVAHCGLHPSQLVISGRSMGTGVATFAATQVTNRDLFGGAPTAPAAVIFGGLVLVSPFTSIHGVLRHFVGGQILLNLVRDRFPNENRVRSALPSRTPLFVFHGEKDTLIPFESAQAIKDAACAAGESYRHSEVFIDPDGDHHRIPAVESWLQATVTKAAALRSNAVEYPELCELVNKLTSLATQKSLSIQTLNDHHRLLRRRSLIARSIAALSLVLLQHQRLGGDHHTLLLWSCLWIATLFWIAPLQIAKRNEIHFKPFRILAQPKIRSALVALLCRVMFPVLCLRNGGLFEAGAGTVVSHVLLS